MEKHLYIIGNGFDIHHGINSSYRNFRDWMYENEPTIINDVEETYGCCDDEWWADFENQLGTLDVLEYARDIASENLPDLMSDHCDRTWNDAQIEVEQNLDGLYSNLRGCFSRWILQLSAPKREKMITLVKKNSLFLTFNYSSNPQPIGFSGILLAKRQNSFYCTYFLHNRNVADTKSPYPIKRLEVIRWFNQKSMVFNQSLS